MRLGGCAGRGRTGAGEGKDGKETATAHHLPGHDQPAGFERPHGRGLEEEEAVAVWILLGCFPHARGQRGREHAGLKGETDWWWWECWQSDHGDQSQ